MPPDASLPPSPSLVTILERLNLFSTLIKTSPNHHLRASEFILDANLPQWTRLGLSPLGTESFHSSGPLGFRRFINRKSKYKDFPKTTIFYWFCLSVPKIYSYFICISIETSGMSHDQHLEPILPKMSHMNWCFQHHFSDNHIPDNCQSRCECKNFQVRGIFPC